MSALSVATGPPPAVLGPGLSREAMVEHPRGRDLALPELREVAEALASRPALWREHVRFVPGQRHYEQLWRDEHLTVWLISWLEDQDTGFHDHDVSAGAVAVAEGQVCEERLVLGGPPLARTVGPGASFDFDAFSIHRVAHAGAAPAVTVHAYSPALWRMGAYTVEADGTLQRHSISYAEELRPLTAAGVS